MAKILELIAAQSSHQIFNIPISTEFKKEIRYDTLNKNDIFTQTKAAIKIIKDYKADKSNIWWRTLCLCSPFSYHTMAVIELLGLMKNMKLLD